MLPRASGALNRARLGALSFAFEARRRLHFSRKYHAASPPLCLVSHDAHRHGAQLLLLHLAQIFTGRFGLSLEVVLLGAGPLTGEFRQYGTVHKLAAQTGPEAERLAAALAARGVRSALCSSTASGLFLETLTHANIRCVSLVHELPAIIAERRLERHAQAIKRAAAAVVFPNDYVRDRFPDGAPHQAVVRAQGLTRRRGAPDAERRAHARALLLARHKIPTDAIVVLNVGYGDHRKGIDLFIDIAARAVPQRGNLYFLWLGDIAPECADVVAQKVASACSERIVFAPFSRDPAPYYDGADVFALTSREDPFPSVLLEAMDAGLSTVAFAGAGGFESLLERGGGVLASYGDVGAFANAVSELVDAQQERSRRGAQAANAIARDYSMFSYAFDLASHLQAAIPRISVIVPSYNYARFLPARLQSILQQTHPLFELIVLDDQSTDDSLQIARRALRDAPCDWSIIENVTKASSVFEQWRRGVEAARGDLIWIAEADDLSEPRFLEQVSAALREPNVALSYCQSRQIDQNDRFLDSDYLAYVSDVDPQRWRSAYISAGRDEITTALSVKNTIPNVSACIFRADILRRALAQNFDEISRYKVAGDWVTYIRVLAHGDIAYTPEALNLHRRHSGSVTASALSPAEALREIEEVQALVAREFTPPATARDAARTYAARLRREFGLTR